MFTFNNLCIAESAQFLVYFRTIIIHNTFLHIDFLANTIKINMTMTHSLFYGGWAVLGTLN